VGLQAGALEIEQRMRLLARAAVDTPPSHLDHPLAGLSVEVVQVDELPQAKKLVNPRLAAGAAPKLPHLGEVERQVMIDNRMLQPGAVQKKGTLKGPVIGTLS